MKIAAVVVCLMCAASASAIGQQSSRQPGDEVAVKELVARYNAARDQEDPGAIRTLFTSDADQLVSSGEWRRGREPLVEGLLRSSRNNPGRRTLTVETVRFLSSDIAIADARYEIASAATRQMWSTFVAVRTPDGWRLTAIRNMAPSR
jgi:uncharacterized protein (TIGR02246 family)